MSCASVNAENGVKASWYKIGISVGSNHPLGSSDPVRPGDIFLRARRSKHVGEIDGCLGVEAGNKSLEKLAPARCRRYVMA